MSLLLRTGLFALLVGSALGQCSGLDLTPYCTISSDCSSLSCFGLVPVDMQNVQISLQGTISVCSSSLSLSGLADSITFLDTTITGEKTFTSTSGDNIAFTVDFSQDSSNINFSMVLTDTSSNRAVSLFDIVQLPQDEQCTCTIKDRSINYTTTQILVHVFALIAGLFSCFFGYRFFKIMLFLSGFVIFSVAGYIVSYHYLTASSHDMLELESVGIGIAVGIAGGFFVMCLFYLGLFLIGAAFGLLVFFFFVVISHEASYFNSHHAVLGTLAGICALGGGLFCLWMQKLVIIFGTANGGAYGIMAAVDYFAEQGRAQNILKSAFSSSVSTPPMCWFTITTLIIWPLFFVLGVYVQYRHTGRRYDHRTGKLVVIVNQGGMPMVQTTSTSTRVVSGGLQPFDDGSDFDDFNKEYPMDQGLLPPGNAYGAYPPQPYPHSQPHYGQQPYGQPYTS